jgi:predicted membrane channel-forming protein YqfA (hemolysin III family)
VTRVLTDPANLGTTIFTLLVIAAAIGGVGYWLLPGLSGVTSIVEIGLFLIVGILCVLLVVRIIQVLARSR